MITSDFRAKAIQRNNKYNTVSSPIFTCRADTNNSFSSDRQDSDDDSILDPEPTRLLFTGSESTEESKVTSPQRKLCPQESRRRNDSSSS